VFILHARPTESQSSFFASYLPFLRLRTLASKCNPKPGGAK
jgi:hypothetical protein